jgi:hypothetical protein
MRTGKFFGPRGAASIVQLTSVCLANDSSEEVFGRDCLRLGESLHFKLKILRREFTWRDSITAARMRCLDRREGFRPCYDGSALSRAMDASLALGAAGLAATFIATVRIVSVTNITVRIPAGRPYSSRL